MSMNPPLVMLKPWKIWKDYERKRNLILFDIVSQYLNLKTTQTMRNGPFRMEESSLLKTLNKHLCSVFSFIEDYRVKVESNLEELLEYSYGMLQKKKASEIIQKELGNSITPVTNSPSLNLSQYESYKNKGKKMNMMNPNKTEDMSSSMMLHGRTEDQMLMEGLQLYNQRGNSFEDNNMVDNYSGNRRDQVNIHRDNLELGNQIPNSKELTVHIDNMVKGSQIDERLIHRNRDINMSEVLAQSYHNK